MLCEKIAIFVRVLINAETFVNYFYYESYFSPFYNFKQLVFN